MYFLPIRAQRHCRLVVLERGRLKSLWFRLLFYDSCRGILKAACKRCLCSCWIPFFDRRFYHSDWFRIGCKCLLFSSRRLFRFYHPRSIVCGMQILPRVNLKKRGYFYCPIRIDLSRLKNETPAHRCYPILPEVWDRMDNREYSRSLSLCTVQ